MQNTKFVSLTTSRVSFCKKAISIYLCISTCEKSRLMVVMGQHPRWLPGNGSNFKIRKNWEFQNWLGCYTVIKTLGVRQNKLRNVTDWPSDNFLKNLVSNLEFLLQHKHTTSFGTLIGCGFLSYIKTKLNNWTLCLAAILDFGPSPSN